MNSRPGVRNEIYFWITITYNLNMSTKLKYILLIFICLFTVILVIIAPNHYDSGFISLVLIMQFSSLFLFFRIYKAIWGKVNWISPTALFLLSYTIVNFQMLCYRILKYPIKPSLFVFIWNNDAILTKVAIISLLGQLGFMIGYLIHSRVKLKVTTKTDKFLNSSKNNKILFFPILFSFIFYFLFFFSSHYYKVGKYNFVNEPAITGYFFFAFNILLSAILIQRLIFISNFEKKINLFEYIKLFGWPITGLIIWHMFFSFIVGDRGPIISYGLLFFGLYFFKWSRVKLIPLLVVLIISSYFFSIIANVRRMNGDMNMFEKIAFVIQDNSKGRRFVDNQSVPFESTVELAMSTRCFNHVVANVPSNYNFTFGYFQLKQLFSVIPGGSSAILKLKGSDMRYDGSSAFITYLIQGNVRRYGDGTSINADLYLDFGSIGILLGLFLFGVFIRAGETALYYGINNKFLGVAILVYFSTSIYMGRSSLLFNLKSIVMIFIIIMFNYYMMRALNKKN